MITRKNSMLNDDLKFYTSNLFYSLHYQLSMCQHISSDRPTNEILECPIMNRTCVKFIQVYIELLQRFILFRSDLA